jgi:MFS family permease
MTEGNVASNKAMQRMPRTIWMLGFVSLLMDTSSELIHALLPIFLVTTLGASTLTVGIIEGFAEAATSITKVFSGVISDWIGKRKPLVVLGYGLAALTKPLFPLASTVDLVVAARIADRIGKGIRGAPRDALVADVTAPEQRGAAFGLRQSLDTIGGFLGPLLAIALMFLFADDIRTVLWFAIPPAFLAVALLVIAVPEPEHKAADGPQSFPISRAELAKLPAKYWWVVAVGSVLTLARFSEAFLILRAQDVGFSTAWIPAVLVIMSAVYAAAAYPAGVLSDRMNRRYVLMIGVVVLAGAHVVLAYIPSIWGVGLSVALWGLHMGFTQGLLATLVADAAPSHLRGTAFGVFNLISGFMMIAASALAGLLWDRFGAPTTFMAGAGFSILALLGLLLTHRHGQQANESR